MSTTLGGLTVVLPAVLLLALGSCRTSASSEVSRLAETPPLHYSVLLSGGAFVELEAQRGNPDELSRTWPEVAERGEAFPLSQALETLNAGRVFVHLELDSASAEGRGELARRAGGIPEPAGATQEILARAREHGHDLVLVIERLRDGPIERRGINGQWPITIMMWLALGLGMLIPDHTFESRASLSIGLREVYTGQMLYEAPLDAGPVDLSLVERGSLLSLVVSILVPPFLLADDREAVVAEVRELTTRRLLASFARQLKSFELKERIRARLPAAITVVRENGSTRVEIVSQQTLSLVRLRLDGRPYLGEAAAAFERDLLASEASDGAGQWRYAGVLPLAGARSTVQVIVQTVVGKIVSITAPIEAGG